jgi:hypothetical protein
MRDSLKQLIAQGYNNAHHYTQVISREETT